MHSDQFYHKIRLFSYPSKWDITTGFRGSEHPEVAVKILNLWMNDNFDHPEMNPIPPGNEDINFFKHAIIAGEPVRKNLGVYNNVKQAIETKDNFQAEQVRKRAPGQNLCLPGRRQHLLGR
ncbi:hypothetical protein [Paenibacillus solani]|uniref:hypothetical protein n=1 Tax=Paenibacillus solani TaxID=1705565 RepID=UPI003D2D7F09